MTEKEQQYETKLLRFLVAQLYFSLGMQVAREMYGKGYFSLGVAEKVAVDQMVHQSVGANYEGLTPDFVVFQTVQKPVGFQNPSAEKPRTSKSEA
jgi:hypothetical protein